MVTADSKQDSSSDGCLGKIPQFLLEEELTTILNWGDITADVVYNYILVFIYMSFLRVCLM